MEEYLKLFNTHSEYETFTLTEDFIKPNVSYCIKENEVHYNPIHDYSKDYFTIEALESGDITFTIGQSINTDTLQSLSYSTDNGTNWTTITNTNDKSAALVTTISVNSGDKILWKGINNRISVQPHGDPLPYMSYFSSQISTNVYGNIMSLIYGDNFSGQTSLEEKPYCFYSLLGNDITSTYLNIINAENLSLPATTLASSCYSGMFYGCAGLTTAPELPATTLADDCYSGMFRGCTSLTTAPSVLPATTLATNCYGYMFRSCTSLTTAPKLSATTIANNCCYSMFNGCTKLTTAPELLATTLATSCYMGMFNGCTSLNNITCLATDISANYCTNGWVTNVAANGTFTKAASMTSWTTGENGIPSNWTVQNAS